MNKESRSWAQGFFYTGAEIRKLKGAEINHGGYRLCKSPQVFGYGGAGVWGCGGLWGCGDMGYADWGYGDIGIWGYGHTGTCGCGDMGVTSGETGIWGYGDNIRCRRIISCVGSSCQMGYLGIRGYGHMEI